MDDSQTKLNVARKKQIHFSTVVIRKVLSPYIKVLDFPSALSLISCDYLSVPEESLLASEEREMVSLKSCRKNISRSNGVPTNFDSNPD